MIFNGKTGISKFILADRYIITTIIRTDNKDLFDAAHSTKAVEEKRLRVELGSIRESIRNKEIDLQWVLGKEQIADSHQTGCER